MPIKWKVFRFICALQMAGSSFYALASFIDVFRSFSVGAIARALLYLLMLALAIFAAELLTKNYPDIPVEGTRKKNFNRLFLSNFLFLAVMFGVVISEYRQLVEIGTLVNLSIDKLPFRLWVVLISYLVMLIFQFVILAGLFLLRMELHHNFEQKKFEFERE